MARYRQVAELHAANLDQGFLATLGPSFLALLYQSIDESSESTLLTEEDGGRVIGFVAGGLGMSPIYRRLLRRPLRLSLALVPSLVRPRTIRRIVDLIRYGGSGDVRSKGPSAELLSIAVAPDARGSGVAARLFRRLEAEFSKREVQQFRIIVGAKLIAAHRYYLRMGAVPVGRIELHQGEPSVVYFYRLSTGAGLPTEQICQ